MLLTSDNVTTLRAFRIYYKDGEAQILYSENMYTALSKVLFEDSECAASDIYKIEEIPGAIVT